MATIDKQISKVEADKIVFLSDKRIIKVYRNVRIYREQLLTTGACYRFRIDSPEFMVTQPPVKVSDPQMKRRIHSLTRSRY